VTGHGLHGDRDRVLRRRDTLGARLHDEGAGLLVGSLVVVVPP
jgi:hypothetical protein